MDNNEIDDEIYNADTNQASRNKPLHGFYQHKKHKSLKLSSQKPKHKFNPD
jgi:hypothetical protein